jgi:predicted phage-related endonuclease
LKGKIMQELNPLVITSATLLGNFENGSEEWHKLRDEPGAIGGSDIGAICGWNSWESAITKWAKKTGKIDDKIVPSHRMRMGTKFEDDLLEIFQEDHPELEVLTTGTWAWNFQPLNRANPDAVAIDENGKLVLIEVKFAGDNMTEIPLSYRAQMIFYMGILNIKRGVLVACAGSNYVELPLEFDAFEFDTLCLKADEFRRYVINDIMPDFEGSNSTLQTIRALNPDIDPDASEELGELGIHLSNTYAELQELERKYKELQSRTLDAMGKAKWGTVNDLKIVYRTSRSGGQPYLAWKKGN